MPFLADAVVINGPALRAIRERTTNPATGKPWTISGLARATGQLKQPYLSLIELDSKKTSFECARRIATILDVPVAAIVLGPLPVAA